MVLSSLTIAKNMKLGAAQQPSNHGGKMQTIYILMAVSEFCVRHSELDGQAISFEPLRDLLCIGTA